MDLLHQLHPTLLGPLQTTLGLLETPIWPELDPERWKALDPLERARALEGPVARKLGIPSGEAGPLPEPSRLRVILAFKDELTAALSAVLDEKWADFRPPAHQAAKIASLENRVRNMTRKAEETYRSRSAQERKGLEALDDADDVHDAGGFEWEDPLEMLRRDVLAKFQLHARNQVLRGKLTDKNLLGWMEGFLFLLKRGDRLRGKNMWLNTLVEFLNARTTPMYEGGGFEPDLDAVLDWPEQCRQQLALLEDICHGPLTRISSSQTTWVALQWCTFLHEAVNLCCHDNPRYLGELVLGLPAVELTRPAGSEGGLPEMQRFVAHRRQILERLELRRDDDGSAHHSRWKAIRDELASFEPEAYWVDFLPWLMVGAIELVGRGGIEEGPPWPDLKFGKEKVGLEDHANNLKNLLLSRFLTRELVARGLDPDQYPLICPKPRFK